MIETLKKNDLCDLWNFLKHHVRQDFYLTDDNRRTFITSFVALKRLLKQSHNVLISKDSEVDGVILLWKGRSGDKVRNYIKINSFDRRVADKLLTVLFWNYEKPIFIKVNKHSPYLDLLKEKQFVFLGGRGEEILLVYKKREKKYGKN